MCLRQTSSTEAPKVAADATARTQRGVIWCAILARFSEDVENDLDQLGLCDSDGNTGLE